MGTDNGGKGARLAAWRLTASVSVGALLLAVALPLAVARAGELEPCVGDCNGDGMVAINELILGVSIDLGELPLEACASFDDNGDGVVALNELILAVNGALSGCIVVPAGDGYHHHRDYYRY